MPTPRFQVPKGTRDLTGEDATAFAALESVARRTFALYGFSEIRTPIFEGVELFSRSLGESSDVVEKEMFTFTDRGERTLALRPEGTAGVVRHLIENSLWVKSGVHRFFYTGPMFRAERPQAGRFRQFWQIGSEAFGSPDPSADAETIVMTAQILRDFGLTQFSVQVNTLGCKNCRPRHREALFAYLQTKEGQLTEESKKRMKVNPLRVLDSKVDGPKLKDAPVMTDFLCAECADHHRQFLSLLKITDLKIEENPRLVRGLDYYTRSVFEIVSPDLGAQSALAAGGRYDDLVELLGGPATPAVGFALGMDRVVMARKSPPSASATPTLVSVMVIPLAAEAVGPAFQLAEELRRKGVAVPFLQPSKKLKNQLAAASDMKSKFAIIIGEDELKAKMATVKNLETRDQKSVAMEKIFDAIHN